MSPEIASEEQDMIVIVGAGPAGASAATELRERGHDGPVTLIGAEEHAPYERPPLSKGFLLGDQPFEKAFVHELDWYAANDIDLRLGTRVTAIDPAARSVRLRPVVGGEEEELSYAALLLATGAQPRHLAVADRAGPPVICLRTVEDSRALKETLKEGTRVAIVGAGWIGLEVAAAARKAGSEVTVFETADLPLLRVLGPEVATLFADLHRAHGVDLRLGTSVRSDDLTDADLIVVGVGAIPDTVLAEQAGLDVDNGVLVDATLRTSDPHIFAIGDIANQDHPTLGRRIRVEHWDTAIEQAKVAAHNLAGGSQEYARIPYFFTDQYDLGMEYFGSVGPEGYDRVDIEGSTDVAAGDAFRAYWVKDGTVVAAMHANDWDATDTIRASIGTPR